MGAYATTTSLQTNMVETMFDTATSALASAMISRAETEVNKWLSKRYDIAAFIAAPPPMVRDLTLDLAEGYMRIRMVRGANSSKEIDAYKKTLIDPVLENLQAIAAWQANIVDTAGSLVPDGENNTTYQILNGAEGFTPTFAEDDETHWETDPDKLEAIEAERD